MTDFTRPGLRLAALALTLALGAIPFDAWVVRQLHDVVRDRPLVVDALRLVSGMGAATTCYVVCGVASVHLLRRRQLHVAVYLASTLVLGVLVNHALKDAFGRDRPLLDDPVATATGDSLPSGHAMAATVAYGSLLLVFLPVIRSKRVAVIATVSLVVLIGFTRVTLGVHYPSDVFSGFAAGVAWLVVATGALRRATSPARM